MSAADDRIGHNEAVFRDINERIEAGRWPGEPGEPIAFRCECASLGCNLLIELTLAAYERVRADPRHFVLAAGHEIAEVELVVERARITSSSRSSARPGAPRRKRIRARTERRSGAGRGCWRTNHEPHSQLEPTGGPLHQVDAVGDLGDEAETKPEPRAVRLRPQS